MTEAEKRAKQKYRKRNPELNKYISYKATAKLFIKKHAEPDDLVELQDLINDRMGEEKDEKEGDLID